MYREVCDEDPRDPAQLNTFFAWEGVGKEGRCWEDLVHPVQTSLS